MKTKKYTPYLFISLALCGLFIFRLGPLLTAFLMSFFEWNLFGSPSFSGLENYTYLFTNPEFNKGLIRTFQYTLFFVPSIMTGALLCAVLLNQGLKGSIVFRIFYFTPVITSTVAVGILWQWIFAPKDGFLNFLLSSIGVSETPTWLFDPALAIYIVAFVYIWKRIGYYMIIYLAGLQEIPKVLYEAAVIDGAGKIRSFFMITLPLISPTMFLVLILSLVDSFKNFEILFTMTKGGPGSATMTLSYWVYKKAFDLFEMGEAASWAMILLLIVGFVSVLNFIYRSRWVKYTY